MIHHLSSTTTHATPIHQGVTPLGKIVMSKNLIPSCHSNKETNPTRSFGAPNTLPRKNNRRRILKIVIEWTNVKPSFCLRCHQDPSSTSLKGALDSIRVKNTRTESISQSLKLHVKDTFHTTLPLCRTITSFRKASFCDAHLKILGKTS